MASISERIKRRCKMTSDHWKSDCRFSKELAIYRLVGDLSRRAGMKQVSKCANKKKEEWILGYLQKELRPVIEKYQNRSDRGYYEENAPIWVCWWTGEEDAPQLVKQCIKSIRKNAGNHPVNLITEKNYINYIDIPEYIISKVNSGAMCVANFSDYLRAALVAKHGGLWIDATVFCNREIPEEYFSEPFFTCKKEPCDDGYIPKGRWTSFIIGGWKDDIFFNFFKDSLERYWLERDSSIDYLLVDYVIEVAYQSNTTIKKMIDSLYINNVQRDDLAAAMFRGLPRETFRDIVSSETVFYKLSWRETYLSEVGGQQTVYGYFLEM